MYREVFYVTIGIIVAVAIIWIKEWGKKRKIVKKMRRGVVLEKEAVSVLKKSGYKILADQKVERYFIYVDGERRDVEIRPDYIVKKGLKKYVAEVKSGKTASRIATKETRRQIMEYYYMIKCDGVLLVNMESRKIEKIEFVDKRRGKTLFWGVVILVLNLLFLVGNYFWWKNIKSL